MKKTPLLALTMIVVICTVAWTSASSTPKPETEKLSLTVTKVFSAKDGDGRFQAYMVNWKGQDVVVEDTLVKTDYHEGQTIPVLMIRNKYPDNAPGPDLIHFMVFPPYPPGGPKE